jgi:hypothetical protein
MEKLLSIVHNRLKKIKAISLLQKERFIANVDAETADYLKSLCKIPKEEQILSVLDDSHFNNLKQVVVFTEKKIYWRVKNASMKEKHDNEECRIDDTGFVITQALSRSSIFVKTSKNIITIFIVGEDMQLIIPLRRFESEGAVMSAFYVYISNYCGGYKPDNLKNRQIFKKMYKPAKPNIFARLFNSISCLIALLLIVNVFIRYNLNNSITNEKIVCVLIISKIISMVFGYKKSMYSNLLLFISTYYILEISESNNYVNYNIVYIIYAVATILFGMFNFDKIFKYTAFIMAIISIAYMTIKYFNIELLSKYIM